MPRVLVTAGAGSIGQSIVKRLVADGHDVIVLDNRECPPDHGAHEQIKARANDSESVNHAARGCDHISPGVERLGPQNDE